MLYLIFQTVGRWFPQHFEKNLLIIPSREEWIHLEVLCQCHCLPLDEERGERSRAPQRWRVAHQQGLPRQSHRWYLVCNIFIIYEETVNSSTDEHQSGKCFAKLSSCSALLCVAWHETVLTGGEIFFWQAIKPRWKLLALFPGGSTIPVL